MLRKIMAKYRESGLIGVLLAILRSLPGVNSVCLYYIYRLPFQCLTETDYTPERIRVLLVQEDSIDDLIKIQNKPDIFRERFRMKNYCVLAYADNEPVACLWAQHGPVHMEQLYGFEVQIASNQLYYFDSHTCPEWRKKGMLRCMLQKTVLHFKAISDMDEILAVIEIGNIISQKAHEKIGFARDRLEFYANIMGRSFQLRLRNY